MEASSVGGSAGETAVPCVHALDELGDDEPAASAADRSSTLNNSDSLTRTKRFITVCSSGQVDTMSAMLAMSGAEAVDVHAGGEAAFRAACRHGQLRVVRELLALTGERTVDVHVYEDEALRDACEEGHADVVRELLSLTGDRAMDARAGDSEALSIACAQGHVDVVRELLNLDGERAVDVHAGDEAAFRECCEMGQVRVVRELLALSGDRAVNVHARDEEAFRAACTRGNLAVVRELLALEGDRAADLHVCDDEAFRAACEGGHLDVVRELLGHVSRWDWSVHQHQRALAYGLEQSWHGVPHLGSLLLSRAPLLPSGLQTLHLALEARISQASRGVFAEWCSAVPPSALPVLQRVLLAAAKPHVRENSSAQCPRLFTGTWRALDALALCAALPGALCASLRAGLLVQCSTDASSDAERGTFEDALAQFFGSALVKYVRGCMWRGICVPLAPAPGADVALSHQGMLNRHGRRLMVLRRTQDRGL